MRYKQYNSMFKCSLDAPFLLAIIAVMESKTIRQKNTNRTANSPAGRDTGATDRLQGRARELAQASLSQNTRITYQGALQRLSDALEGRPLTDQALAAYLTSLHEAGKSPAVAAQVVALRSIIQRRAGPFCGPYTGST